MDIIVAGIGTDVGKTLVSAILCQALAADYWKPVQAGNLDNTDSHFIARHCHLTGTRVLPECYRLQKAVSPHIAAASEGAEITLPALLDAKRQFKGRPRPMVIETAGGLMSPLSESLLVIDLIRELASPVVLVVNYYLGSINHSLLSLRALQAQNIPLLGMIFSGDANLGSRDFILRHCDAPMIAEIPFTGEITPHFIDTHAAEIRKHPAMA